MGSLTNSRQAFATCWLSAGLALVVLGRSLHGVFEGAAIGAGLAMLLTAVYVFATCLRKRDDGWLPSRDDRSGVDEEAQ